MRSESPWCGISVTEEPALVQMGDRGDATGPVRSMPQAPRELQVMHLAGVAFGVSLLLAVGVHWFRQLPDVSAARVQNPVVTVQLLPTPSPAPQPQAVPPQTQTPIVERRPDPPMPPAEPPAERRDAAQLVAVAPVVALQTPPTLRAFASDPPPLPAGAGSVASDFQRVLFGHIERYRQYTDVMRDHHLTGVVQVMFRMARNGTVLGVRIRASSGQPLLDREAVDTVWRAQPLPPVPAVLPAPLNILLPVAFGTPE
jgi:periplasmic protein TonB